MARGHVVNFIFDPHIEDVHQEGPCNKQDNRIFISFVYKKICDYLELGIILLIAIDPRSRGSVYQAEYYNVKEKIDAGSAGGAARYPALKYDRALIVSQSMLTEQSLNVQPDIYR
uniref:Uncharacterized protein n=1 Tax=Romanomermis culicivorax TaxID=13658 RepID=A0A915IJZ6_ROMCU